MTATARTFVPGAAWAFVKLYCGETTAERLLRELPALTDGLEQDQVVSHWFFVRYADPSPHLRLRFHVPDPARWQSLVERVHTHVAGAVRDELVWKVQLDTYNRELERYGDVAMEASERLFHRDSRMVMEALGVVHEAEDEELRWRFGLRAIARLLTDFDLPAARQFALIDALGKGLLTEQRESRTIRAAIEKAFRERKAAIEVALGEAAGLDERLGRLSAAIDARSAATAPDRAWLLAQGERLPVPIDSLVSSHLHMFCNRLFVTRPREHELVLYWFLAKHLRGRLARTEGVRS